MYKCEECGAKGKVSDLEIVGNSVMCAKCRYVFFVEGLEVPKSKLKVVTKKK